MEEEGLSFHVHILCHSPPLILKKKIQGFAKVDEEGHACICDYTPVPVRKPVLKYGWLEISNYKKKLPYLF